MLCLLASHAGPSASWVLAFTKSQAKSLVVKHLPYAASLVTLPRNNTAFDEDLAVINEVFKVES